MPADSYKSVVAGEWNNFTVVARNMANEDLTGTQPPDGSYTNELLVQIEKIGKHTTISDRSKRHKNKLVGIIRRANETTTNITDNRDGTFEISFLCSSGGLYAINVGLSKR